MDKGVLEKQLIEFRPISQIIHGGVIEFEVPNNSPYHYIDLKNSRIKIKAKIVKDDTEETALEELEEVGPCNLTLQSMFSQVDLMIQGVNTSSTGNYWPYKCYMESVRKRKHGDVNLSSEIYVMDTANGFEKTETSGETMNAGFKVRFRTNHARCPSVNRWGSSTPCASPNRMRRPGAKSSVTTKLCRPSRRSAGSFRHDGCV